MEMEYLLSLLLVGKNNREENGKMFWVCGKTQEEKKSLKILIGNIKLHPSESFWINFK